LPLICNSSSERAALLSAHDGGHRTMLQSSGTSGITGERGGAGHALRSVSRVKNGGGRIMSSGLLRIDADVPVYRIFPLWFFEEALRLKQLVLVRPDQWEDPYEILASSVVVTTRAQPGDQMPLEPHLKHAY